VLYVDSNDGVDRAAVVLDLPNVDVSYETNLDRAKELIVSDRFECLILGPEPAWQSKLAMLTTVQELADTSAIFLDDKGSNLTTAFEAGADEYASPPTDSDTAVALSARITSVVGRYRAERAATEAQARSAALVTDKGEFRALAEQLDQVVWIRRPDGSFRYANAAFESTWKIHSDALCADATLFEAAIHPDDRPADGRLGPGVHEYRVPQADGSVRWLRDHVHEAETGSERRIIGVAEDITARQRLSYDLEASVEALGRLYEISAAPNLTFDVKVGELLEAGCDLLGLPTGMLTRIEDGVQRSLVVHGMSVADDETWPLTQAYCRRTIDSENLVSVRDASNEGWVDDPAYSRWGFACYLGGKVVVENELYGTVCFGSAEPREEPFTPAERSVVELLIQWVSYELTQQAVTARLRRRNERLDGFTSVVSHDLRNPLNVVSGRVQMAHETSDNPETTEQLEHALEGIERMEDLIADLLSLARLKTIDERQPVSLDAVAQGAWRTVPTGNALLTVQDGLTEVTANPLRLRQLFENLFRNSIEHGPTRTQSTERVDHGDQSGDMNRPQPPTPRKQDTPTKMTADLPTIAVTVGPLADGGFYVEDDGKGLSDDEPVFTPGYTTADEGTGLGLAIVEQICRAHDWVVRTGESETGGARFEFQA
jgi:PAS domain S-box-containing protein